MGTTYTISMPDGQRKHYRNAEKTCPVWDLLVQAKLPACDIGLTLDSYTGIFRRRVKQPK